MKKYSFSVKTLVMSVILVQRQCYTLSSTLHCTLIFTYKDVRRLTADVCLTYPRQNDTDSATQVCSFGCTCNVTIGANSICIELENHFFRTQLIQNILTPLRNERRSISINNNTILCVYIIP